MFEKLTNTDISIAIDKLAASLGVRETTPCQDLVALVQNRHTQACVQEIASRLGLPIRISLSYVPDNFRPGSSNTFETTALGRTDWTGHGFQSITAQVSIPGGLPMFGTASLQDFLIRVRVSENCREHPETFIALMAHELSHVLLASLRHPQRDSELHTDLVPILLGFRDVVDRGRKTIKHTKTGQVVTTQTTRYGYLTDAQFDFAYRKVGSVLHDYQRDKAYLLQLVADVHQAIRETARHLERFGCYLGYLDMHPPRRMKPGDAQRVVRFHASDYARHWEVLIEQTRTALEAANAFAWPLVHYTDTVIKQLERHVQRCEATSRQLAQATQEIMGDVKTLRRYVPFLYRLRHTLAARRPGRRNKR